MRPVPYRALLVIAVLLGTIGCGGNKSGESAATPAPTGSSGGMAASAAPVGSETLPANLDQGPRAAESGYDEAKAELGEKLFQTKGCSACHAFGRRVTCPDLAGVTMRRTAAWMESQILHPDLMVKQDPTARELFAKFALQMPKQGLTPDEAKAVIEFFKHKDHEAGDGHEAGKEKH